MNGRYVLDTNIVIALFDEEVAVLERISAAEEILIPSPAAGELYYGAYHSRRPTENSARVDDLVQSHTVIDVDIDTARYYGRIKSSLMRKGTPIPNNDIWIAALTQQYGATVASRDEHFEAVENLVVARW